MCKKADNREKSNGIILHKVSQLTWLDRQIPRRQEFVFNFKCLVDISVMMASSAKTIVILFVFRRGKAESFIISYCSTQIKQRGIYQLLHEDEQKFADVELCEPPTNHDSLREPSSFLLQNFL